MAWSETTGDIPGDARKRRQEPPSRRSYDTPRDTQEAGTVKTASVALDAFTDELRLVAQLIEEKSASMALNVEILASVIEAAAGSSVLTPNEPGGEAKDGYSASVSDLARLVKDMQYHDAVCQQIDGVVAAMMLISRVLDRQAAESTAEQDAELSMAIINTCKLGSMRERWKSKFAAESKDPRLRFEDPAPADDNDDSITLF